LVFYIHQAARRCGFLVLDCTAFSKVFFWVGLVKGSPFDGGRVLSTWRVL
jgi:hypothetical protein